MCPQDGRAANKFCFGVVRQKNTMVYRGRPAQMIPPRKQLAVIRVGTKQHLGCLARAAATGMPSRSQRRRARSPTRRRQG
eukprot:gene12801-biopygen18516